MKKYKSLLTLLSAIGLMTTAAPAFAATAAVDANKPVKIGVVNFKECVETSKLGKQEQVSFDNLKKQMETVLEEKEKSLNDMASKLNNEDYLDSLTAEAETELKRKFRALNQELNQQQGQYYQALNQANMKVVQKLQDVIAKASEKAAKDLGLDIMLNDEGTFYFSRAYDVTSKVVAAMDEMFEKEEKSGAKTPAVSPTTQPTK